MPEEAHKQVYAHQLDPNRSLPGGVYLDEVQREQAEIQRAKLEGREPDLENPPAIQSTPLIDVRALDERQVVVAAQRGLLDEPVADEVDEPFDLTDNGTE